MERTYLRIHHMSTPMGECLTIHCPHCNKTVELEFRTLPDDDTVVVNYGKELPDDETIDHDLID